MHEDLSLKTPIPVSSRIPSLDVLRGIAVLGGLFISIWIFGGFTNNQQIGLLLKSKGFDYRLFGTVVLDADRRNPQLAARLATAFRSWRSLEKVRREQARRVLEEIKAQGELSTDLRDIVERTLA